MNKDEKNPDTGKSWNELTDEEKRQRARRFCWNSPDEIEVIEEGDGPLLSDLLKQIEEDRRNGN